jgi:hypothetical protein
MKLKLNFMKEFTLRANEIEVELYERIYLKGK